MRQAPTTSRQVRDFMRVFLSGASDEIPDKQGRVTIPVPLRQYAGLTKDCTVIGAGSRIEVWDSTAWNDYLASTEQAYRRPVRGGRPGPDVNRPHHPPTADPRPAPPTRHSPRVPDLRPPAASDPTRLPPCRA